MMGDYFIEESDAGTVHLSDHIDGPAFCGYEFEEIGRLGLDVKFDADAVCTNCERRV